MNSLEKRMVQVLKDLKDNHHVVGVKAEFESEGTRMEEALRLKEVVSSADLELTIKIGGCEALRDMYEARVIGASRIVAPMIESPYALTKYLNATKLAFPVDEWNETSFLVNIETIAGFQKLNQILSLKEVRDLDGIVFGRVDMVGSMGLSRDDVNAPQISEIALHLFTKAKEKTLQCVIGGGVSAETIPFIKELPAGLVDYYETRKIVFKCPEALNGNYDKGILKAVGFELMWLKNKRDFYGMIFTEDKNRIEMLQSRYDKLIEAAGGKYE
jgi:4-hydroxy-2-oxoheptanedioate aldolase